MCTPHQVRVTWELLFCRLANASLKQHGFLCSLYHPGAIFPAKLKGMELKKNQTPQKGVIPFKKVLIHLLGKNNTHLYLDIGIAFALPPLCQRL